MLVLVGGDETTRHVISGGVEALLRHPDQLARLRAEPELLPGAIEEMLRWVSPIRNMNRTATVDVEVNGQQVKEGDRILLLYPSANRDETVFDGPVPLRHHPLAERPRRRSGRSAATTASAPRSPASSCGCCSRSCWPASPTSQLATDDELPRRRGNFVLGLEHVPVTFTPGAPAA